jgi:hypothetical protein
MLFKITIRGVVLVVITLVLCPLASAVDMVVNITNPAINNGDSKCSLIEALNNANSDSSAIHIDCPAGNGADTLILSAETYTLNTPDIIVSNNGLPQISSVISIQGNGAIIQRSASASAEFRLIEVKQDAHLILDQITLSGGRAIRNSSLYIDAGGGIHNQGTLTLINSTVSDNSTPDVGGGIYNNGTMTITESHITNNSTDSLGGGIFNRQGTIILTKSTVSDNLSTHGGIYNGTGVMTLIQATVSGNSATNRGGGIYNNAGTMTLTQTTVSGNSTVNRGGGIYNSGTMTFTQTTVSGNSVINDINSGIIGGEGGGIYNLHQITLSQTTVSGNTATNTGGGINNSLGSIDINNSIISGNSAATAGAEINQSAGTITTIGVNILGHDGLTSTQAFFNFIPQTNSFIIATSDGRTPVKLSNILNPVLADNNGSTLTHALIEGSPAIDAVPAANCNTIQDQRGASRPVDGDDSGTAECDSGAFEFNSSVLVSSPLDIDGNNSTDALTDGLLIIRYLFGLRGNALISGAIGSGASNTTAADINDWLLLQESNNVLDIDGNGNTDALTDGLLVIRFLFGLRDDALISGAIGPGATRSTAAAIEAQIQALLGQET